MNLSTSSHQWPYHDTKEHQYPSVNRGVNCMNTKSCTHCNDIHICPGIRTRAPHPNLYTQINRFVADTFIAQPHSVVNSSDAWDAYQHWCIMTGQVGFTQRQFVNAMSQQPGIRRVKRSTMRFAGINWKRVAARGRHAAPELV